MNFDQEYRRHKRAAALAWGSLAVGCVAFWVCVAMVVIWVLDRVTS
jgi:hypothetical protein